MKRKLWQAAVKTLPAGLTMKEAAAHFNGVHYVTVCYWLKKLGYDYRDGRKCRVPGTSKACKVPWDKIDWSRSYASIARQYGVSRQAAHFMHQRIKQAEKSN